MATILAMETFDGVAVLEWTKWLGIVTMGNSFPGVSSPL